MRIIDWSSDVCSSDLNLFARWPLMGVYVVAAVPVYVTVSVLLATRYIAPANVAMNAAAPAMGTAMPHAVTFNPTLTTFRTQLRANRLFLGSAPTRHHPDQPTLRPAPNRPPTRST